MNVDELNRINEFRQIRKEVRGSDKYLLVGIDVGKENHYAFYGTATGKTLKKRLVFGNDFSGIEMLMDIANGIKEDNSLEKVVYGMEPTSNTYNIWGRAKPTY